MLTFYMLDKYRDFAVVRLAIQLFKFNLKYYINEYNISKCFVITEREISITQYYKHIAVLHTCHY